MKKVHHIKPAEFKQAALQQNCGKVPTRTQDVRHFSVQRGRYAKHAMQDPCGLLTALSVPIHQKNFLFLPRPFTSLPLLRRDETAPVFLSAHRIKCPAVRPSASPSTAPASTSLGQCNI